MSDTTTGSEHVKVHVSAIIPNTTVDQLWSLVGSFNGLPSWFNLVEKSEMENNVSDNTVGGFRSVTAKNGTIQREQLLAMDLRNHFYTYTASTAPWKNYQNDYFATIRVKPLTYGNGGTIFEWSAEFTCPPGEGKIWHEAVKGIYESGVKCLHTIYK